MTKSDIIKHLNLAQHPRENGFYRRTYEASQTIYCDQKKRIISSFAYYLLTDDQPINYLHKNKSDIIHFYHLGSALKYYVLDKKGDISSYILGPDILNNQQSQLIVRGGNWKAAQLLKGEYSLISEAVVPGFYYEDNEIATYEQIQNIYPKKIKQLAKFIKTTSRHPS